LFDIGPAAHPPSRLYCILFFIFLAGLLNRSLFLTLLLLQQHRGSAFDILIATPLLQAFRISATFDYRGLV
jgi:hypothetical protein